MLPIFSSRFIVSFQYLALFQEPSFIPRTNFISNISYSINVPYENFIPIDPTTSKGITKPPMVNKKAPNAGPNRSKNMGY